MRESVRQAFVRLVTRCEEGFTNEHEWMNWWKKHAQEIRKLPPTLGNRVSLAWEQASAKEFSRVQPTAGPSHD